MDQKAERSAILQALSQAGQLIDLPPGATALDLSGGDADLSAVFLSKEFETARLKADDPVSQGVTPVEGLPAATGLPDAALDLVGVAGIRAQSYQRELGFEAARILKPQGRLVLCYASPVVLPGTVAALTESLALQFNPFWPDQSDVHAIAPHLRYLAMSGFVGGQCFAVDTALEFSRDAWVAQAATQPMITQANLSPVELHDFKLVLHDYIKRDFGAGDFFIYYRTLTYLAFRP